MVRKTPNGPVSIDTGIHPEPDLIPFRDWLRANRIGVSTGYRLVEQGRLKLVHIGKRSYLNRETRATFLKSLEQAA